MFIPVQKYKSQYKNESCGTKNLTKNGKKNITKVRYNMYLSTEI